jgi:DNA-binding CsgD family transcriptional regulator/tetratricopeptide (TPR) repeat protein
MATTSHGEQPNPSDYGTAESTVASIHARQEGSQPLVGRRQELSTLDRVLAQLRSGSPGFLEIVGEPGIGKTRLLTEVCTRAEAGGQLVLAGQAEERDRETPLKVVIEAIDHHLALRLEQIRPTDLLAAIFPALASQSPSSAEMPQADRYRLQRAVRTALETLAASSGLVLALDDMHWAGLASVELLTYLLRHPPRGPVLVALAYRPRQACPRLTSALAGAAHPIEGTPPIQMVERLDVGPLTLEEVDELLGPAMSWSRRRALYLHSGGNPLYLEALARAGSATAVKLADGGGAMVEVRAMPATIHATLLAEFDTLPWLTQVIAQAAAVAGDPFEPELTAVVAAVDEVEVLAAIDELVARDLVRPVGAKRFRYRHPLVRQVAYEAAEKGWRLTAHARAARALAARGASVVARAHHVEQTARPSDQVAIATLAEAARHTMDRAPATSAHWLAAAVRLLPGAGGAGEASDAGGAGEASDAGGAGVSQDDQAAMRRLELLVDLARALGLAGRFFDSRVSLYEVLRLLPPERFASRVEAAAWCALVERLLGRHAESRALLLRELAALPDHAAPQAAILQLGLASADQMAGDIEASCRWGEQALVVARRFQDRPLHAAVLGFLANACCLAGEIGRAMECATEAAAVVDGLPDGELVRRLPAIGWLGWSELSLERHDAALRHLTRGLALATQTGQSYVLPHLLAGSAFVHRTFGNLSEAAACSSDAVEVAQMLASDELRTMAFAVQCRVAIANDDLDLALRAGSEAVKAAGSVKDHAAAFALAVLGEAHLAADEPAACVQAIVEAGGGPELLRLASPVRAEFCETLVRAELAQGHAGAARTWAERAEASAPLSLVAPKAFALLARARILESCDLSAAAERALAAATAFSEVGRWIDAGRAHLFAGAILAAAGDRTQALAEFDRAGWLFADAGARSLSEQAIREQQRLAPSTPHDPRVYAEGLGALSPRELEIARLVSKGWTNQQIARQLHLSSKTVETHLSRIFAKLEVSSRAAVATAVALRFG